MKQHLRPVLWLAGLASTGTGCADKGSSQVDADTGEWISADRGDPRGSDNTDWAPDEDTDVLDDTARPDLEDPPEDDPSNDPPDDPPEDDPPEDDPPEEDPIAPAGSGLARTCAEWSFDGTTSGWALSADLAVTTATESDSTRFTTEDDPFLTITATEDLERCSVIDVVLRVTGGESTWGVYWARVSDEDFSADRQKHFNLFTDEQWHRYLFDMSDHPDWNGTLDSLRIDPRSGAGTVEIRSVRLHEPDTAFPPDLSLSDVTWLHTDVSGWSVTAGLSSVSFSSTEICLDYDKAGVWSSVIIGGDTEVVANPWVFIWHPSLDDLGGQWYGATWEWMRPDQTCKGQYGVAGDHIKQDPFGITSGWRVSSGERIYFMVSGLARSTERNHEERSEPLLVTWP